MSAAREDTLAKVRCTEGSAAVTRKDDYAAIRREYRQAGTLDREQRLRLFEERLRDYEANVYRCTADSDC